MLRPYSYLSNLKIWDYYTTEDLAHGPSYDIEIVHREIRQNEDSESLELMGQQQRKIINGCYDNVMIQQPDHFCWQFQVKMKFKPIYFSLIVKQVLATYLNHSQVHFLQLKVLVSYEES